MRSFSSSRREEKVPRPRLSREGKRCRDNNNIGDDDRFDNRGGKAFDDVGFDDAGFDDAGFDDAGFDAGFDEMDLEAREFGDDESVSANSYLM